MLNECIAAFNAIQSAKDARRMLNRMDMVPEPYAGDGRQILARRMVLLVTAHQVAKGRPS